MTIRSIPIHFHEQNEQNEQNGQNENINLTKEQYRSIVELSPLPIIIHSKTMIAYVNPAATEMIGAETPNEIIGRQISDFIHPHDLEIVIKQISLLVKKGKPSDLIEKRLIRLDGNVITVEVRAVPITFRGEPALELLCRDITESKHTQKVLHESEQRYRRLVQISPEPIVLHSDGILIYLNDSALKLLVINHQEVVGRSVFDFIHPDYHELAKNRILQVQIEDSPLEFIDLHLVRIDGKIIETEVSSVEVFNYLGRTVIQSVFRDKHAKKRNDDFLRTTDKLSTIGKLAAGVAHEIRNPLTALIGFTQLLKLRHEDNRAYCEIMLSELERINFIVNEFMQLSRPHVVDFKQCQLQILLDNIISLLDTQAILNNVQIITEHEKDIPLIYCDDNQLKQVFMNVMKNAIESMPNGGNLFIQTKVHNNKVLVCFIDQGYGIPKELIPKIGEPFFTTKEKGTGLGLMVSYSIIEAHKGTMFIESELGLGTTVNIILPLSNERL